MSDQNIKIAIIGDRITGKSTLINALLGKKLLPASVLPDAPLIIDIKYGAKEKAVLHFRNPVSKKDIDLTNSPEAHSYFLATLMNNILNKNAKSLINPRIDVPPMDISLNSIEKYLHLDYGEYDPLKGSPFEKLEIFIPEQILKSGIEIIEIPSSLLDNSRDKEFYLKYLKQTDKIIFLLRADQLCSCVEMDFVESYLKGDNNVLYVINIMDKIPRNSKKDIKNYAHNKLKKYTDFKDGGLFFMSALNALDASLENNSENLEKSGILKLEKKIKSFVSSNIDESLDYKDADMNTASGIDSYIKFAEELIKKYEWSLNVGKSLRDRLDKIKKKQKDKNLNLSIVGEFSIGKSTFINALLRTDLLASSSVQGTTVASTVLEYSNKRFLSVRNKNGKNRRFDFNNNKRLKEYISKYAANPSFAKGVDSLSVGLPSENLKQGIRIIDTPGTNALESWHEETTVRAIEELSDASIILVDATKPLPTTQKDFVHNYLEGVLPQCVFVVTKIDLVHEEERAEVVEYIKQQISYEFDIDNPFVVSYASLDVLEAALSKQLSQSEKVKKLLDLSNKNETKMYMYINNRKAAVQANKLTLLLEDIYTHIGENMQSVSDEYRKEHELLEKTKNTNLSDFVRTQTKQRLNVFRERAEQLVYEIESDSEKQVEEYKPEILSGLDSCNSNDAVKNFVNNTFSSECSKYGSQLTSVASGKCVPLKDIALGQITLFRADFKKEYERLGLLPMDNSKIDTRLSTTGVNSISISTGSAIKDIDTAIWDGVKTMGGGAAAGALIGTFFGPGIGTAIGAAIGGWLFSPSVDSVKNEAKNSLKKPLDDYFNKVLEQERQSLKNYIKALETHIADEIAKHYANYNTFVENAIKSDRNKQKEIEEKINYIQVDMDSIEEIKNKLALSRESLK